MVATFVDPTRSKKILVLFVLSDGNCLGQTSRVLAGIPLKVFPNVPEFHAPYLARYRYIYKYLHIDMGWKVFSLGPLFLATGHKAVTPAAF